MLKEITEATQKHYDMACEKYGNKHILGVFPYGSINYGLYIKGKSDVDTKAIYIPDFEDLMFNKNINREVHLINRLGEIEHCEVKDIRDMIYNYNKANINFLETLFTKFKIINPIYEALWNKYFIQYKNDIVLGRCYEMCKAAAGQALHTASQVDGWNGKKISNVLRLYYTINRYIDTKDFNNSIQFDEDLKNKLIQIKTSPFHDMALNFNQNEYDNAISFCKNIISMNKENFYNFYHFDTDYINFCQKHTNLVMQTGAKKIVSFLLDGEKKNEEID